MNKKALYEAIMKDISKIVKKKINENMEENTINIPSQYYDEDGDIDLSDLSILPKNIIKALVNDLLTNGDFQEDDRDDDCLMCSILPYIDSKNVEEYDYESLTKQILDSYDDIQEDDKVARDISYLYEITLFNHTIFYTCYKVPVIGDYDIDNIDEDENCSIIECKEYNNVYTDKNQLESTKDVIDDARTLLEYTNKRNYFIEQIIKKYRDSNTKDIKLVTELLKLSYDQGFNCSRLDNI